MPTPKVSVIITVYNGEKYIRAAIDSVLSQTFSKWECIVINDGSMDGTSSILDGYHDPRLVVIYQQNKGRGPALNSACSRARGDYLAILDADDACLPERLSCQTAFLEANPEVGLVGSAIQLVDEFSGRQEVFRYPTSDSGIRRVITRYNPFCNSAIMIRRSLWRAVEGCDESLSCSLDYDFSVRAMQVSKAANLPEVLAIHRLHPEQYFLKGMKSELRERIASRLRLQAAWKLRLPPQAYFFPIGFYVYARLPLFLKPNKLKVGLAHYLKQANQ